ncbi:hypothetical protein D3C77_48800 [compost metagenome]
MNDKIIGRFEPIGAEIGPPRQGFDVLTIGAYEFNGKPGYKGERLSDNLQDVKVIDNYSVISEFWQWVPTAPHFERVYHD